MAVATVSKKTNEYVVKTILKMNLEQISSIPIQGINAPQSTINYKYQVYHSLEAQSIPMVRYFGIGIRGFYNADDENLGTPFQPEGDELDLYTPIPLRCVPVDQDLSTSERSQYRMRVRKVINGEAYYCYYLKTIRIVDNQVKIERTDPVTGTTEPYEISSSKLNPVPTIPETSGTQSGVITEVNVTSRIGLNILGSEVLEVINAMYDGDLRRARISEFGLYTGEDQNVTGYDANGVEFPYTESIYTQLAYKICNTGYTVTNPSDDINRVFLLGDSNLVVLK